MGCTHCMNDAKPDGEHIIQKIKDFKCDGCYPLNENLDARYKQFL
jgi:hypothetical protein